MATQFKQIVGAVLLALSAIGAAQADTVKFTGFLGGRNAEVDLNAPRDGNFLAGEFSILWNDKSFSSICIDVKHDIGWNTKYSDYTSKTADAFGFTPTQISLFNKLYTAHYAESHTSNTNAAAFQLAAWEITYDGNGALDLGKNNFQLGPWNNATFKSARSTAASWLSGLGNEKEGQWKFTVLDSKNYQDQLIAMPVPEPAEIAMLLAGLGLIGGISRRKAQAAAAV